MKHGQAGADHPADAAVIAVETRPLAQFADRIDARRIGMICGYQLQRAVVLQCVDRTPVGKPRDAQTDKAAQRGLGIQRQREQPAGLSQEFEPFFSAFAFGDVKADADPSERLALSAFEACAARENRIKLVGDSADAVLAFPESFDLFALLPR